MKIKRNGRLNETTSKKNQMAYIWENIGHHTAFKMRNP